jgi:hypothetical protein
VEAASRNRPARPRDGSSGRPARGRRFGIGLAGAAAALTPLALVLLLAGCGPRLEPEAPAELRGVWTTTHPVYADRSLRVDSTEVGFGVGAGRVELHPLEGVERLGADQAAASFRLHYLDPDGTPEILDLELRFGAENVLRVPHIDADWIRARTAPRT